MNELHILKFCSIVTFTPYFVGNYCSIIVTEEGDYPSELTVEELMNQYCLIFGSSLNGRKEAARRKLNFIKNPPVLVSEVNREVAFQVPDQVYKGESMWVFDLDFEITEIDSSTCKIFFKKKNLSYVIPLSKEATKRRKTRAIELLYSFLER